MTILRIVKIAAKSASCTRQHQLRDSARRIQSFSSFGERYDIKLPINWGACIVPEPSVFIIERFGKYNKTLTPGIHPLIPFVDKIAYVHSMREEMILVADLPAKTKDDADILISGDFRVKIVDAKLASYKVKDLIFAVKKLAETTIIRELIRLNVDETLEHRELLNSRVLTGINTTTVDWGIQCHFYETREIVLPSSIKERLEALAETDIRVCAQHLECRDDVENMLVRSRATALAVEKVTRVIKSGGLEPKDLEDVRKYLATLSTSKEGNFSIPSWFLQALQAIFRMVPMGVVKEMSPKVHG